MQVPIVVSSPLVPPHMAQTTRLLEDRLQDLEALLVDHLTDGLSIVGAAISPVAAPAAPTIAVTGGAGGSYTYQVVATGVPGGVAPGTTASTAAGPTTLSVTAYNTVSWAAVPNATGYLVYRTAGGSTQGKIAAVGDTTYSVVDNGLIGDGTTPPVANTTGCFIGTLIEPPTQYTAAGAINPGCGVAYLNGSSAQAMTLIAPKAGAPLLGGMDGMYLTVFDTVGKAHTITTPTNGINGSKHIATYNGTVASNITFVAIGGVWWVVGTQVGVTLS